MIMKEHTLQDVADDITGVIGSLAYFVESEALDVNGNGPIGSYQK